MPPLPVIAGTYRVAFNWSTTTGQHAVNVMHFSGDPSDAAGVADDIITSFVADQWKAVTSSAGIDTLEVLELDGTSGAVTRILTPTERSTKATGGVSGAWIPASAVLVHLSTPLRGRSHHGRNYLPFVAEGGQTNGTIEAGLVTDMNVAWEGFLEDMATTPTYPAVASYKLASADAVTSFTVEGMAATQRRRQSRLR